MNAIRWLAAAAALMLAAGAVPAQPGPGPGPGASAPCAEPCGPGRMGGRWGSDFTPGWSLMTPADRREHQTRMRAMTSYEDCKAYLEKHHEQMAARAKEKGRTMPARPAADACAGLQR